MNHVDVAAEKQAPDRLFHGYQTPPGAYDEMFAADGQLRVGWPRFVAMLDALGARELSRRWEQARRLIHENGVIYNVHGDPQGRDRRWELDALPLVMPTSEWSIVAAGLAQRARLLNALLVDLYGPQRLVREGILPGELLVAHPGFLRACHGWNVPGNCYLHLYAAHLARSSDGGWRVVADRSDAPVGAGYALENRIVMSRMIPHVFHHCQVRRLAGFFIALRDTLRDLAPRRPDGPHTVLLSPGPASPTYFEDSYLARYLGYTLVEGEDLTVRDNRVFLKTLGGLVGVDVILRRMRQDYCDPLELDSQSRWGVAGLVHAARRGNVLLANALGSSLADSPALMAFLPAICQRLLDEPLALPSVQTFWCGDGRSLGLVLEMLDQLVIRSAFGDSRQIPIQGGSLSKVQRAELAERIKQSPANFVAQQAVVRSTAPVWQQGAPAAGHIALRAMAVAGGETYEVLPGALAQVSTSSETPRETMFVGQASKDVWVLADGPVEAVTLLEPPGTPIAPRRSGNDLPSRVADSLFWLGRHVERAEGSARLLRSIFARLINESAPAGSSELALLYRALTGTAPAADASGDTGTPSMERQVLDFLYDPQRLGSLHAMLASLSRVATVVRDRISLDTWRILKRIDDDFRPGYPLGVVSLADVLTMLNQMVLNFSAFSGVAMENMTRGPGWQFLDVGRRVERA
ncbi:MAG TPA: circularly permuted type 2 ATP-grasp protein, partial [Pirellulales bacterium]|nr:circularly permuted type 2 ATP-grasp protein [Pirellulales bacterium]